MMTREALEAALIAHEDDPYGYAIQFAPIFAAARKQLALMAEKCSHGFDGEHWIPDPELPPGILSAICPGKVYPPETVEKIAESIYNGNLPTPTFDKTGRMIPFLTSMNPDTFRAIAVAVLDALGETE